VQGEPDSRWFENGKSEEEIKAQISKYCKIQQHVRRFVSRRREAAVAGQHSARDEECEAGLDLAFWRRLWTKLVTVEPESEVEKRARMSELESIRLLVGGHHQRTVNRRGNRRK